MKIAVFGYAHPFGVNKYYGAERVIWYNIQEWQKQGHECVVFSVKGTDVPGFKFVEVPVAWKDDKDVHYEYLKRFSDENYMSFDHIHSYMSSGFIDPEMVKNYNYTLEPFMGFRGFEDNLIAYSHRMNFEHGNKGTVIHYGVPESRYGFLETPQDFAVWIGRIDPGKAPHLAIEAAKRAGLRLVLMGPAYHYPYFIDKIWPHIDNDKVIWLRSVTDPMKELVFQRAKVFLSTNSFGYHEMFGIVNIESLRAGCPVIGWAHKMQPSAINLPLPGHKGEIIEHGVHGFINEYQNDEEEGISKAVEFIGKINQIDRNKCRKLFLDRFTAKLSADKHLQLFNIISKRGKVGNVSGEIC